MFCILDVISTGICVAAETAAVEAQLLIAQPLGAEAVSRLQVRLTRWLVRVLKGMIAH